MFIIQNAAITVIYYSLQCINSLVQQDSLSPKKLSQVVDSKLLSDTIACLLLIEGSSYTITTDIQSLLTPNIHEHAFLLHHATSSPSFYSLELMNANNTIDSNLLSPTITLPFTHPAYFHHLLLIHEGVSHEICQFYQAIQDEIVQLLHCDYLRQHPVKPTKRPTVPAVPSDKQPTPDHTIITKKAYLENVMTNVYIALIK